MANTYELIYWEIDSKPRLCGIWTSAPPMENGKIAPWLADRAPYGNPGYILVMFLRYCKAKDVFECSTANPIFPKGFFMMGSGFECPEDEFSRDHTAVSRYDRCRHDGKFVFIRRESEPILNYCPLCACALEANSCYSHDAPLAYFAEEGVWTTTSPSVADEMLNIGFKQRKILLPVQFFELNRELL